MNVRFSLLCISKENRATGNLERFDQRIPRWLCLAVLFLLMNKSVKERVWGELVRERVSEGVTEREGEIKHQNISCEIPKI